MAAMEHDIRRWFVEGKTGDQLYMIVVCDTYDHEDYPVFVGPEDDFKKAYDSHNGPNMTRIMEVYDLNMDREAQLAEFRAFHFPPGFER